MLNKAKRSPNFYYNENIIVGPLDIIFGTKRNNLGPKNLKKINKKNSRAAAGFEPLNQQKLNSQAGALDLSAMRDMLKRDSILAI